MCGIAGIFALSTSKNDLNSIIRKMTAAIAHRGPDGEGFFVGNNIAIGHRRLSILDLSKNASQPFFDEQKKYCVTYNGEIYNYAQLRTELEKNGYSFKTTSDTEVLLYAFIQWGENCVNKLNGMFAFAIVNTINNEVFLARDRMGIKPLFYYFNNNVFLFASEIKSILTYPKFRNNLNKNAFVDYLLHNYTIAPQTMFEGVKQLMSGHTQKVCLNNNTLTVDLKRYWNIDIAKQNISYNDATNLFDDLMSDAVKIRLKSDVKVGTFLSGGIDSGTISYYAKYHQQNIKSYSIIFNEQDFNEQSNIKLTSHKLDIENECFKINPNEIESIIDKIVYHSEELTADSSMLAYYVLCKNARKEIKVALSGDGADEILSGYETYSAYYLHNYLRPFHKISNLLVPITKLFNTSEKKVSLGLKMQRFVESLNLSSEEAFNYWRTIYSTNELSGLVNTEILNRYLPEKKDVFINENTTALDCLLLKDLQHYLLNDMLVKADRMSMAHGLEVRVPFLDHRIVEFLFSLPDSYKMRFLFNRKRILKSVMKDRLPNNIINQRKKGFNIPNGIWLKKELKEYAFDTLSEKNIKSLELINFEFVNNLLNKHINKKEDHSHQIWGLLMFVKWWEKFMK